MCPAAAFVLFFVAVFVVFFAVFRRFVAPTSFYLLFGISRILAEWTSPPRVRSELTGRTYRAFAPLSKWGGRPGKRSGVSLPARMRGRLTACAIYRPGATSRRRFYDISKTIPRRCYDGATTHLGVSMPNGAREI